MFIPEEKKPELLKAMYRHAMVAPAAIMFGSAGPPVLTDYKAKSNCNRYIDYLDGRCIKTDFSKSDMDFRLYNRDSTRTGEDIAKEVLSS